jgi:hypothetical protein
MITVNGKKYDNEKQLQNHLSRVILNVQRGDENFHDIHIFFSAADAAQFKCFRSLLFQQNKNIRILYTNISKLHKAP